MVSISSQINLDSHFLEINNTKINNKQMATIAIKPPIILNALLIILYLPFTVITDWQFSIHVIKYHQDVTPTYFDKFISIYHSNPTFAPFSTSSFQLSSQRTQTLLNRNIQMLMKHPHIAKFFKIIHSRDISTLNLTHENTCSY